MGRQCPPQPARTPGLPEPATLQAQACQALLAFSEFVGLRGRALSRGQHGRCPWGGADIERQVLVGTCSRKSCFLGSFSRAGRDTAHAYMYSGTHTNTCILRYINRHTRCTQTLIVTSIRASKGQCSCTHLCSCHVHRHKLALTDIHSCMTHTCVRKTQSHTCAHGANTHNAINVHGCIYACVPLFIHIHIPRCSCVPAVAKHMHAQITCVHNHTQVRVLTYPCMSTHSNMHTCFVDTFADTHTCPTPSELLR